MKEKVKGADLKWTGLTARDLLSQADTPPGPGITTNVALAFSPVALQNWTAYKGLYREMRVSTIALYLVPQANMSLLSAPTANVGNITVEATPTDFGAGTGTANFSAPRSRTYPCRSGRTVKIVCRPQLRFPVMILGGGTSVQGIAARHQWVSTDVDTINYPIGKVCLDNVPGGADRQSYLVHAKVYVKFRNVR